MNERLVLCGGASTQPGKGADLLRLDLSGPNQNVTVRVHDITKRMVRSIPDLLVDLLEVAAYVYSADWATRRGGPGLRRLGADWRRQFHFVIPVRDPDTWCSPEVIDALTDTLGFLSDDDYRFDFERYTGPPNIQHYLEFGEQELSGFKPDEVILFSGGLDSLAGAVEEVLGNGKSAVLVSHHSSTKIFSRQRDLVEELRNKAPGKFFHVPVKVQKKERLQHEFTLRSRSFLFASLAAVVGKMFGNASVRFFENGVVSLNLPILPQIVGARATRTTHPRVLDGFGKIFSAVFDEVVVVDNPFALKTKAEAIRLIEDRGCGDMIRSTISCTRVRAITKYKTHCGTCSQCIDRRFGTLAAGLEGQDPEEMYEVRLLEDERESGETRTMAEGYVKSAVEIRQMTDQGFLSRFAGEMSRALGYLPGSADDNARSIIDLHKRHADGVFSVMENGVRTHAADLVARTLPPNCLLMMAVSGDGRLGLTVDPQLINMEFPEAPAAEQAVDDTRSSEIRIALDEANKQVLVAGLPALKGEKTFELVKILSEMYIEDQSKRRAPENYQYFPGKRLADRLRVEDPSLRRLVSRIRNKLFKEFQAKYGLPLPQDALLQNVPKRGYRLNPAVRVLDPSEVGD